MSEENVSAPVEQSGKAVEQPTAVESIQQEKPSIMMDKEVASDMASKAADVNSIDSGDPVENGLSKGLKMSGVAGDPVAAPANQIAPVSAQEGKTSARVSPVADVPADAQVNAEGSSPSATPEKEEEAQEEPEKEEEAQEEPEKEEETQEEPEKEEEAQEEPEKEEEAQEEPEKEEEAQEEPEKEEEAQEEPEKPEGAELEGEPEQQAEEEPYTPFGDPLRNVIENQPEVRDIDRKTVEDSNILLTDIPGKLRIY